MARANRVVVRTEGDAFVAEFFKTHKSIAVVEQRETSWVADETHNPTQRREAFRTWVQNHADEFGVDWLPELQEQAWERKYWKYETDAQVEEDAFTLMKYTIRRLAEATGYGVTVKAIALDAIVPNKSDLSYIENGKYVKNGNWAVATVNLAVTLDWNGEAEEIIYPIEMRSGQLTKIKMTSAEFKSMVAEVFDADLEAQGKGKDEDADVKVETKAKKTTKKSKKTA